MPAETQAMLAQSHHRSSRRSPGLLLAVWLLVLAGCAVPPEAIVVLAASAVPTATAVPSATATQTPLPTATATPPPTETPAPTAEPRLTLAAVGDMMMGRAVGRALLADAVDSPFAAVAAELASADITVGNLECSLGNRGTAAPKAFTFQAPAIAASALAEAGFDVLTLANNHSLDYGPAALDDTIGLLGEQQIRTVGAGANAAAARAPVIIEAQGIRVALLGYVNIPTERGGFVTQSWTARADAPGVAWAVPSEIAADVAAVRPLVDHVVVLLHSGYEYSPAPNGTQQQAAHAAIDAGATLVIGHHPHVLQPIERYGNGLIAYSLGNFVFNGFDSPSTHSVILRVTLSHTAIEEVDWQAVMVQDGRPVPATAQQASAILAELGVAGETR